MSVSELERRRRELWKSDWMPESRMRYNGRHLVSEDKPTLRSNYVGIEGTIALDEFLAWVDDQLPHVDKSDLMLNWVTLRWVDQATHEEVQDYQERRRKQVESHEKWERETLARLKAKYK